MTRWLLLSIVIVTAVLGDLLQSHEMKVEARDSGHISGVSTARALTAITRRKLLALSIAFMAISFFAFLALVQREPISFAVPASAGTFVLETLLAKWVLNEEIDWRKGVGSLLVLGGIILLSI
jgi:drug/metabolite transporter (DMT)-like permease